MTQNISLTINDKSISVPAGTTIMEAATQLGVSVPHFCWHPGLSIAGVCRFCMVKIEGNPKLQIACNTPVTEGMKVDTVNEEVKDAHKWALEFHLINHPLDCPICDQAGECELQNYYMKVGKYQSQMEENKVLKPKALDVGPTLVLDTERCILCSRCVRFEDEVTKTSTLGIFNRGDRAVINTYGGRKINHNYSYNLADICPVGAFTAKDFRFQCRVWFLQEVKTICPGCSTGCNVTLYFNKNQRKYYRLRPRFNQDVNGYWMCDTGRFMYEHVNADNRLATPMQSGKSIDWTSAQNAWQTAISADKSTRAVVISPQYTNEEYELIIQTLQPSEVYIWTAANEKTDYFDGILERGDKHPNRAGLFEVMKSHNVSVKSLNDLAAFKPESTIVFGPEREAAHDAFEADLGRLSELSQVVYFGTTRSSIAQRFSLRVPTLTFAEKSGHFTNQKGIKQSLTPTPKVFPQMLSLGDFFKGANKN